MPCRYVDDLAERTRHLECDHDCIQAYVVGRVRGPCCGPASKKKKHCQGTDKYRNGVNLQNGKKLGQGTDKYRNVVSYVGQLQMARNIARVPTNTKTALAMWTIFKMARNLARVPTNTETALAMWPVSRWQETWPGYEQIPKRR